MKKEADNHISSSDDWSSFSYLSISYAEVFWAQSIIFWKERQEGKMSFISIDYSGFFHFQ